MRPEPIIPAMAAKKKRAPRRKKAAAASVGLSVAETSRPSSDEVRDLVAQVEADGGAVLGSYRDPFGGASVLLVALPIDRVEPTPYQRDPSDTHVKRLMTVIEKVGRFLDPVVLIRQDDGYWTPNGNHRLQAMRKLGAKSIVGLLVPEPEVAFKILALNTEKAHNVKEKSLETIRMARALAGRRTAREGDYAFEFEQAPYLTLGAAYEAAPRSAPTTSGYCRCRSEDWSGSMSGSRLAWTTSARARLSFSRYS